MTIAPRLDLRQSQQLVMTPQLQQAIKLLQLNNLELSEFVDQELERNPLLEREDAEGPQLSDGEAGEDEPRPSQPELEAVDTAARAEMGDSESRDGSLDVDYDNVWNNDGHSDSGNDPSLSSPAFSEWGGGGGGFDNPDLDLEQTLSDTVSLRDHLIGQLNIGVTDTAKRLIGLHLIDMLDEAGYLTGDLGALAENLGCAVEDVEELVETLQHFDPPGIFARDLKECLALQLQDRNRLDPAMQAMLDNLEMLARRDFAGLARVCGVDRDDINDMLAEIRALDPKPAQAFNVEISRPVVPDILMRPKQGGGWLVELNNDTLPRVLVNNRYYEEVSRGAKNRDDKRYINECYQSANWLARSLHQRATTILKVAGELVRQQENFFALGVRHLKPLVLRDIADAIEMHESTVSRVTSNKYISTPRGMFELKYFFSAAINSADGGEAHSALSVRHRIKELIDAETADRILSDDAIVGILKNHGIDIARRTVAKYREAMGIAPSSRRRREKSG